MSDCSSISDVDAECNHSVKVVTARFLYCKRCFPKSPWLNNLICQHEALTGQYLPLGGKVSFLQTWLQGKIVQSKLVISPIELHPKMGASYHGRYVLTVIERF